VGHERRHQTDRKIGCVAPGFEWYCTGPSEHVRETRGIYMQMLAGSDVRIVGPVGVYAAARFGADPYANLRFAAGLRLTALTRSAAIDVRRRAAAIRAATVPPADAIGRAVRLSFADGVRRSGQLVSLSETDLVLRNRGRDVHYPVADVLIVETEHHTAAKGALIGGAAGTLVGWLGVCGGRGGECGGQAAMLYGIIGTGAGALMGAIIDATAAKEHVVYVAGNRVAMRVAPILAPNQRGMGLALEW
jgi:hypothetical protein